MRTPTIVTLALGILGLTASPLAAQGHGERPDHGGQQHPGEECDHSDERRGPPQEALDACYGAGEGDGCSFEGIHGTVDGTCETPRRGESRELVCMPDHGHSERRQR